MAKEKKIESVSKADQMLKDQIRDSEVRYLAYLATLNPRDRELLQC